MTDVPEVSVVMSAYNGAAVLDETMQSILAQEGVDFEFIVVNDGSIDDTGRMLDAYARRDQRVRVIHQDNQGLTAALIRGCNAARGAFIARQDVGDLSHPGRLSEQLACLKAREDCVFVSCWTDMIGPRGEFLYTVKGTGAARQPIDILSPEAEWGHVDGPTSHPSVMFRTASYRLSGGYRVQFYFGQDWDLWYRLAELGKFQMLERPLCACRVTTGSISSMQKKMQRQFAEVSKEAMLLRRRGVSDQVALDAALKIRINVKIEPVDQRHKAAAHYFIGRCLLDNGDPACVSYLRSAVCAEPLRIKLWISLVRSMKLRYASSRHQ